jgi:hypothetical protein
MIAMRLKMHRKLTSSVQNWLSQISPFRSMTLDHQSAILMLQGRRYRAWLDEVNLLEKGKYRWISPQSQCCEAVDIVLG